jgi:DNA mismatch repair protein MutL
VDIIQLLPDNIANQIAAGEVIQRPANAVKELLENAVDAGATEIRLIVQDAGKALVQVIDNGKGMSETDARMSFERHATSKIHAIDDLFHIKTMGFRGEALASIAAVAQVELKTRRAEDELGVYLEIENSTVQKQELCACAAGTNIGMKNLFFNVPARRNFLKSNAAEMRHIVDEFIHVAMAFPNIFFSLTANGDEVFHLETGNLKQRVIQILGNQFNTKLVQVKEETDYMNITGFVGKPEAARKTRGDQYFFVNDRFIKSAYLNHAVSNAFSELIPKENFPLYVLFIELDPSQIDINVHPTKQEIKFEDEKIIYAFVQAAVKHALATFSIAPSLDFTLNADIQKLDAVNLPFTEEKKQSTSSSGLYQTFTQKHQAHFIESSKSDELKHWKNFYENPLTPPKGENFPPLGSMDDYSGIRHPESPFRGAGGGLQIHNTYIIFPSAKGFILVHQQLAHERVLFERFERMTNNKANATQQLLFPSTIELSSSDAVLLAELLPDLVQLGYAIEPFGKNTFVIQGTPADILQENEKHVIELLLEQLKHFNSDLKLTQREKLIRCLARQQAIKAGKLLQQQEMQVLVEDLFSCKMPGVAISGNNPTYLEFKEEELDRMFGRK